MDKENFNYFDFFMSFDMAAFENTEVIDREDLWNWLW